MNHPSFLALDRLVMGSPSATTQAHLEACAQCRTYVDGLRAQTVVPAWVRAHAEKPRRPVWTFGLMGALAAASVLVMIVREPEAPTGTKGGAAVAVYVKREADPFLWDGKQPLRPGDTVRLRVVPDGSDRIAIFDVADRERPTLLFAGVVSSEGATILPKAWVLEGAASERLLIVLSRQSSVTSLAELAGRTDVSTFEIVLPKDP